MHVRDTGESGMVSRETTPGLDIAADVLHSTECYRHRSRTYPPSSSSQIMASPNAPSQQHSRRCHSAAFPALLPIPFRTPTRICPPSAGTRRLRTPSLDELYNAINLLQNVHAPTPMTNKRENLDHLTLSRYVFNLSR